MLEILAIVVPGFAGISVPMFLLNMADKRTLRTFQRRRHVNLAPRETRSVLPLDDHLPGAGHSPLSTPIGLPLDEDPADENPVDHNSVEGKDNDTCLD